MAVNDVRHQPTLRSMGHFAAKRMREGAEKISNFTSMANTLVKASPEMVKNTQQQLGQALQKGFDTLPSLLSQNPVNQTGNPSQDLAPIRHRDSHTETGTLSPQTDPMAIRTDSQTTQKPVQLDPSIGKPGFSEKMQTEIKRQSETPVSVNPVIVERVIQQTAGTPLQSPQQVQKNTLQEMRKTPEFQMASEVFQSAEKGPVTSALLSEVRTEVALGVKQSINAVVTIEAQTCLAETATKLSLATDVFMQTLDSIATAHGEPLVPEKKAELNAHTERYISDVMGDLKSDIASVVKHIVSPESGKERVLGDEKPTRTDKTSVQETKSQAHKTYLQLALEQSKKTFLQQFTGTMFKAAATFLTTVDSLIVGDKNEFLTNLQEKVVTCLKETTLGKAVFDAKDSVVAKVTGFVETKYEALKTEFEKIVPRQYWPTHGMDKEEKTFMAGLVIDTVDTIREEIRGEIKAEIMNDIESHMSSGGAGAGAPIGSGGAEGVSGSEAVDKKDVKDFVESRVHQKYATEMKIAEGIQSAFAAIGVLKGLSDMRTGYLELKAIRTDFNKEVDKNGLDGKLFTKTLMKVGGALRNMGIGAGHVVGGVAVLAGAAAISTVALPIVGTASGIASFLDAQKDAKEAVSFRAMSQMMAMDALPPSSGPVMTLVSDVVSYLSTGKTKAELFEETQQIKSQYGEQAKEYIQLNKDLHTEKAKAHLMKSATKLVATHAFVGLSTIGGVLLPLAVGIGIAYVGFKIANTFDAKAAAIETQLAEKFPKPPESASENVNTVL